MQVRAQINGISYVATKAFEKISGKKKPKLNVTYDTDANYDKKEEVQYTELITVTVSV
jgi:hypothetical protein